ncbi:hypothetical protein BJY21_001240 [Kineosphaera limosa]|uniref:Uncharacterized protein n=1 Tax=Kineosphaera limosa NBRC 100340 TaxID=1184609 RepID=K6W994_9MICO|nr:hypothetical protein [Kineosphaera limosa]NYE00056.1 hypothetical protein [Kineosphaera limosa]GAB95770.1 hypothetical protein KILIM_026_00410 [Kineosphaera limosa NBRC 100340]
MTDAEKGDEPLTNRRRVAVQYESALGSAEMVLEKGAEIAKTIENAQTTATRLGAERAGVIYFGGQDDMIPTLPAEVEPNPMCGYRLSAQQVRQLGDTLDLHGVKVEAGGWVPLGQPMRGLIPLLLDERSEHAIATVPPVAECPAG